MGPPPDRRAYRRTAIEVPLEMADLSGAVLGRTVDVSRGGLFAATTQPKSVGTLLRLRVLVPGGEAAMAVGVVVRSLPTVAPLPSDDAGRGVAIALTSTSEAWDRFWDDVGDPDRRAGQA